LITFQSLVSSTYNAFVPANDIHPLEATSIDIERIFSRSRLLLSHTWARLSMQRTHAVLCLGAWSIQKLVKNEDIVAVSKLDDVKDDDPMELEDHWDSII